MAKRGRKSAYIVKLTSKDQNLLKALKNVGYLTQQHVQSEIGLSAKRLLNFQRDNYIEKCAFYNKETKEAEHIYRLTDRGKTLCQTQLNLDNFYKSASARHDLGVANTYFSFSTEDREKWKTEGDMRNIMHQHIERVENEGDVARADELRAMLRNGTMSVPDAGILKDGRFVAIEVITSSYGLVELAAKEAYVEEMGFEYKTIKI
ncbi:hypothetical protein [Psychrobacillus sp. NPDC093180]|uniref:hypothetical protein n=1 Tax=Psychrobacillus sp. NPDC093180 TaxID=3364489 RepID=UPI00382EBED0